MKVVKKIKKKKKYRHYEEISREFKKIKPPMFNREIEKGEEVEAWFSSMKKYFEIYNSLDELKEKVAIYNLNGNKYIWWKDIKKDKGIKERYVTWKTFKKIFKRKYLSEHYYEEKYKEFYELRLGAMIMNELCSKLLRLICYAPYIIDEQPKI